MKTCFSCSLPHRLQLILERDDIEHPFFAEFLLDLTSLILADGVTPSEWVAE